MFIIEAMGVFRERQQVNSIHRSAIYHLKMETF